MSNESTKSRAAALLMALFLGGFGVHRFYVGKNGTAVAQLILTLTLIGTIASGIWALIDCIMIVTGSFEDKAGCKLVKW